MLSRSPWAVRCAALTAALVLAGCAHRPGGADLSAAATPTAAIPEPKAASHAATPPAAAPTAVAIVERVEPPSAAAPLPEPPAVAPVQAPRDLWERIERGFAMPDLDDERVAQWERWYASRPDYLQRMVDRGSKYLFHVVEELERRQLPAELALLPFIESAFNPQAVSRAKAVGMWQFMPATGKHFDLKQNAFRDDRRDVLASTRAALDYLERLHRMFGDWHLALAAYNWGEGNVQRAIRRNAAAGLPTGYSDLRMPDETRHYVPKLQAVKNLVRAPQQHGVTLPPVGNHPFFDTVRIERDLDVALIARLADVSEADFRTLNPAHDKPVIMAAGTPEILLPWDNAVLFTERLRQHRGSTASWTAWRVPRDMTVAQAARELDWSEAELRAANRIPPRMKLKAGSTLLVPREGRLDRDVPEHLADHGQVLLAPEVPPLRTVRVQARKGDTLATLAKRHGVKVADLAAWNGLKPTSALRAGQALVVQVRGKAPKQGQATQVAKGKAASQRASARVAAKRATPGAPAQGGKLQRLATARAPAAHAR
ncbi:membrane-bound lytic murein transglycosylase D [Tepidimonas ignava]|uniref:Membrane-bound lytic murein transglycosylase D n=1 Tax=Tepidimonas ignava TaxID=114249 RepID=A0A4R3LKJ3_9BURK|nr:membrane-bound lytic murein transglycosylase D [Tepidimonas ignava]TSE22863.1 Membrane-bound lytic murein transglycosylase D [Tepidimonas ignava]